MVDNGGQAFPTNSENAQNSGACYPDPGMTLRDYFASNVMVGLLSNGELLTQVLLQGQGKSDHALCVAKSAFAFADAMIKVRKI